MEIDYNDLIIRFCKGDISNSETQQLNQWINRNSENKRIFTEIRVSWMASAQLQKSNSDDTQGALNKLDRIIAQRQAKKFIIGFQMKRFIRIAAVFLILISLSSVTTYFVFKNRFNTSMVHQKGLISVIAPLGAKAITILPDGSKVWLNAGSQITYESEYGKKTRSLDLIGEAYFDVAKDAEHPFIVNTPELKIRALGTRFNVKAYPEEKAVFATLEEGRIDVQVVKSISRTKRVVLSPNESIVFQKETKTIERSEADEVVKNVAQEISGNRIESIKATEIKIIKNVNTELFTSWKEERWIIENESLENLAPMLERRYNVKIVFKDADLKKFKFTGSIQNETIEQIVNALGLTAPVNYTINKDTVVLTLNKVMQKQFENYKINAK